MTEYPRFATFINFSEASRAMLLRYLYLWLTTISKLVERMEHYGYLKPYYPHVMYIAGLCVGGRPLAPHHRLLLPEEHLGRPAAEGENTQDEQPDWLWS